MPKTYASKGLPQKIPLLDALLHDAIEQRDVNKAEALLAKGANPNQTNSKRVHPLLMVAERLIKKQTILDVEKPMFEVLLQAGADITITDKSKKTLLHYAALFDLPDLIEMCLQHGAKVNAKDNFCVTPLQHAINAGSSYGCIQHLLNAEADPNIQDTSGNAALHQWTAKKRTEHSARTLQALLNKGANPMLFNHNGETSLSMMCQQKDLTALKMCLNHVKTLKNHPNLFLMHSIGHIQKKECISFAQLLVKHGADPQERDKNGHPPTFTAIKNDNLLYLQWLLPHQKDLTTPHHQGYTLLECAQDPTLLNGMHHAYFQFNKNQKNIVECIQQALIQQEQQHLSQNVGLSSPPTEKKRLRL